ncbi:MAG: hypothetical protein MRJ67_15225 [Nitrospirales bacterium]|nr:hypothetical protein [Nitrospira sp.]MDR4461846.1 hypothetical protein [Nitrospirales bacterium]MDR4485213.1 hypothetical protein [Nitrospirales bacterium]
MKTPYMLNLVSLIVFPTLTYASSYAPLADFSAVSKNPQCRLTSMQESFLNNWTPPAQFFMVPSYPNAVLASAMPSGNAQIHGQAYQTIPSAVLLTPDPPEKILEFYKSNLGENWFHAEDIGIFYLYRLPHPVASGEALTRQLMSKPGSIPNIAIDTQLSPCDQAIGQGARTRITVVSPPR